MGSKETETPGRGQKGRGPVLPAEVEHGLEQAGGLRRLLASIPRPSELSRDVGYHHALSDPTRQRILWALSMSDLCPCLLKRITRVSDSKLSYHLAILERSGLVRARRRKNWRIYAITSLAEDALEIH